MPRQIPLKRARGGEDDVVEGCASIYLKGIVALIAFVLIGTFCQMAYDAREFLVRIFIILAGVLIIVFAIQEREQIKPWLTSMEEQIEQWAHDDKRFVIIVAIFSILIFLILAILGIVLLLKRY